MKKCILCCIDKCESDFYKARQVSKDGVVRNYLTPRCKTCVNLASKDPNNIDRIAKKRRALNETVYGKYLNFKNTKRDRAFGDLSFEKFEELFDEKCCYCQKDRPKGSLSLKDMKGKYDNDNVIPVCKSCLIRKARMDDKKFIKRTAYMYGQTPEQKEEIESLIGQKFNYLTVTAISNRKKSGNRMYYTCLCDCGVTKDIRVDVLKTGDTKSCGCKKSELMKITRGKCGTKSKEQKDVEFGVLNSTNKQPYEISYLRLHNCSKGRRLEFTIDLLDYSENYYNKPCHYCGTGECTGLDRIDSSLGYLPTNIVSCCKICNSMKNTLSVDHFINHINKICGHRGHLPLQKTNKT
jgi:hypothetical protein